jgi:hypothetical protein
MAKLKAGTVSNLSADTLAGRMDEEFVALWPSVKDIALPNDTRSREDRRLLFVAIARGMLRYLEDHEDDIGTTEEEADGSGSDHDHRLRFEWE